MVCRHGTYLGLGFHVGVDLSTSTGVAIALLILHEERPRYLFCKVPLVPFEACEFLPLMLTVKLGVHDDVGFVGSR